MFTDYFVDFSHCFTEFWIKMIFNTIIGPILKYFFTFQVTYEKLPTIYFLHHHASDKGCSIPQVSIQLSWLKSLDGCDIYIYLLILPLAALLTWAAWNGKLFFHFFCNCTPFFLTPSLSEQSQNLIFLFSPSFSLFHELFWKYKFTIEENIL